MTITTIKTDADGNVTTPDNGMIIGGVVGTSGFQRVDAHLQIGMPGANPQGMLAIINGTVPGDKHTEGAIVGSAYTAASVPQKMGSMSWKWWNLIPGQEAGVLRLNATYANGTAEYIGIRVFGGGGVTMNDPTSTADTNAPGPWVFRNYGDTILDGTVKLGVDATGAGSASLGSNCPASTTSAPHTWLQFISSDGSTVYVPAYK